MSKQDDRLDEVGPWSEIKLDIVRKYAKAYSTILSKQPGWSHYYIDGFAGAGEHISETTREVIPGSPLNALNVDPPFDRYFLVDRDAKRVARLRQLAGGRDDVELHNGDCSDILVNTVLPQVKRNLFRRALCLLDPYGMHLKWEVLVLAGKLGTIGLFLNFPIMDMKMNVLFNEPERVNPIQAGRMNAFWGDDSWKRATYEPNPQGDLFSSAPGQRKLSDTAIARVFAERLRTVAGFAHVPEPIAMRNKTNAIVYFLVFASTNGVAAKIAGDILGKYRGKVTS